MNPLRPFLALVFLLCIGAIGARAADTTGRAAASGSTDLGTTVALVGTTYFIDPINGDNDTNTGLSPQSAWRTFRNIFTYRSNRRPAYSRRLAAGDTIYVMNGTITEIHRPGDDNGAANVTGRPSLMRIDGDDLVSQGGTQAAPIRILAYPGHHPLLDAGYQGDCIVLERANWIEIAGLRISRGAGGEGGGIKIAGGSDISIYDCEVFDNSGRDNDNCSGLNCKSATNVRIYDCVFYDNYDREAEDTGGISTPNSTNMVFFRCRGAIEVRDCLIYQTPAANSTTNSGAGIKYKHSTPDPTSTFEVHRNVFRNCKFFSFQTGSANTHFHHNIIIGGNTAISTRDCGGPTHQVNQVFEYNTIYRPHTESNASVAAPAFSYYPTIAWRNTDFPNDPKRVIFRHNIVSVAGTFTSEDSPITINPYINDTLYTVAIPELFVDHNCYYNASGTAFRASIAASTGYGGPLHGGYFDWTQWRALTWVNPANQQILPLSNDALSVIGDPHFIEIDTALSHYDPASNAFRPTTSTATAMGAYTTASGDTLAPSVPTGLAFSATSPTSVTLTWTASTDNVGVAGYRIYRDGSFFALSATTNYTDTSRTTGNYQVAAFDGAGNLSASCAETSASYGSWVTGNFTAAEQLAPAITGPLADPSGSGLTNLERYACGLPARGPAVSPATASIITDASQNYLALTFPRKGYAPDLEYVVQASTDLVTWTDLQTVLPGYPKTFTVLDPVAIDSSSRRFLRLRVTQQ